MNPLKRILAAASLAGLATLAVAQTGPGPSGDDVPAPPQTGEAPAASDTPGEETLPGEQAGNGEQAEAPATRQRTWEKREVATLRGLDKITGRYTDMQIRVGEPIAFGSLEVVMQVCFQTPPEEVPESAAFLQVDSMIAMSEKIEEKDDFDPRLFSGWMFASSPGLNALEHPVYDVWVIECERPDMPGASSDGE